MKWTEIKELEIWGIVLLFLIGFLGITAMGMGYLPLMRQG